MCLIFIGRKKEKNMREKLLIYCRNRDGIICQRFMCWHSATKFSNKLFWLGIVYYWYTTAINILFPRVISWRATMPIKRMCFSSIFIFAILFWSFCHCLWFSYHIFCNLFLFFPPFSTGAFIVWRWTESIESMLYVAAWKK